MSFLPLINNFSLLIDPNCLILIVFFTLPWKMLRQLKGSEINNLFSLPRGSTYLKIPVNYWSLSKTATGKTGTQSFT